MVTVWKIAPGRNADFWPECRDEGCITINWENQTDLSKFKSEQDLRAAIKKYGIGGSGPNSICHFVNNVQEGHTVVANDGMSVVVGIGVVKSGYLPPNDPRNPRSSEKYHRHAHRVNWVIKNRVELNDKVFKQGTNSPTVLLLNDEHCRKIRQAYLDKYPELKETMDGLLGGDSSSVTPKHGERKIAVIGLGDRRPKLGFPAREDLKRFINVEIMSVNEGRFRYTKKLDDEILVLSKDGWACGHFVIKAREEPSAKDFKDYPDTKAVYIVASRSLYAKEVKLFNHGIKVSQAPRHIDEKQFATILKAAGEVNESFDEPTPESQRNRVMREIQQRLGQGKFRERVLAAYEKKCAITGFDAEQSLDAALIQPYCDGGSDNTSNGILLRSDIHNLYDFNLLSIHPKTRRVHLAAPLLTTQYAKLENVLIREPKNAANKPGLKALEERWVEFKGKK